MDKYFVGFLLISSRTTLSGVQIPHEFKNLSEAEHAYENPTGGYGHNIVILGKLLSNDKIEIIKCKPSN